MVLFHVTRRENVESILINGLIPQLGRYAQEMGETVPAVWLFPCLEDAEEMAPIWLEPVYGHDLAYLRIELPEGYDVQETGSDYELLGTERIPPENITVER